MSDLANIIKTLQDRFEGKVPADLDAIFQFDVDGKVLNLTVKDGDYSLKEGPNPDAGVTFITDMGTLKEMINGETDGMAAFMSGKLRTEGDMSLAMKLGQLLGS